MPAWHELSAVQVAERLHTAPDHGLPPDEAARRLQTHGPNEIREPRRRGPLAMFLGQFTDCMILVLIAAAIVSGLLGDEIDTFTQPRAGRGVG